MQTVTAKRSNLFKFACGCSHLSGARVRFFGVAKEERPPPQTPTETHTQTNIPTQTQTPSSTRYAFLAESGPRKIQCREL